MVSIAVQRQSGYSNNKHKRFPYVDGFAEKKFRDRNFLSSPFLLNSQTGEMNRVSVKDLGEEVIAVRTQPTPAIHYRLNAEKFSIDLWYSRDGEWVALQSTTENDSRLRYVLQ